MTERRYSEEEVAAIFERATETQEVSRRSPSTGGGMTLAELQDIGREVGIAPEAIASAARTVDLPSRPNRRTLLGLPITVARSAQLRRRLTDTEWEQLVVDLRETFDARGTVRVDGSFRQWTNGNLQALLEPTPDGRRLRLRTTKGSSRSLIMGSLAMLGMGAVTFISTLIAGGLGSDPIRGTIILSAIGLGMFGLGALPLPSWARLRGRQMDEVISRLPTSGPPAQALPADGEST